MDQCLSLRDETHLVVQSHQELMPLLACRERTRDPAILPTEPLQRGCLLDHHAHRDDLSVAATDRQPVLEPVASDTRGRRGFPDELDIAKRRPRLQNMLQSRLCLLGEGRQDCAAEFGGSPRPEGVFM